MEHDLGEVQTFSQPPPAYLDGTLAYEPAPYEAPADGPDVLQALESLEEAHRSMPQECAQLAGLQQLPQEARQAIVSLLALPAPGREAVRDMMTLPQDQRLLVWGVARLPAEVQYTLRALLS